MELPKQSGENRLGRTICHADAGSLERKLPVLDSDAGAGLLIQAAQSVSTTVHACSPSLRCLCCLLLSGL